MSWKGVGTEECYRESLDAKRQRGSVGETGKGEYEE